MLFALLLLLKGFKAVLDHVSKYERIWAANLSRNT
jgi:hypothetical protein